MHSIDLARSRHKDFLKAMVSLTCSDDAVAALFIAAQVLFVSAALKYHC